MGLPVLLQKLFKSSGYGPELNDEIVSRYISVQDWSSSYDYAPATLARGSDGLLYWSIAASGPGVSAGAQDPVADAAHAYWSSVPSATPSLGDVSNAVATTEWVRDLGVAPVYLSPAGSDSNDGLSASSPVQTFARAIAVSGRIAHSGGSDGFIIAAAGSYTGNVAVDWMRLHVRCSGAITINGSISLDNQANLIFETSGAVTLNGNAVLTKQNVLSCTNAPSWTQTGGISVSNSSLFFLPSSCTASVTRNSSIAVSALGNSLCHFGPLTVTSNGGSQGIVITQNAEISVAGDLTVNVSSATNHVVSIVIDSFLFVDGNVSISTPSISSSKHSLYVAINSTAVVSGSVTVDADTSGGVLVDNNSVLRIYYDLTVSGSSSVTAALLYIASRSFANVGRKITLSASGSPNRALLVTNGSGLYNGDSSSVLDISCTSASGVNSLVDCSVSSWCIFTSLTLNGRVNNSSIYVVSLSYVQVKPTGTVSGTVTVGKRFDVNTLSFLQVGGAGLNRIPGAQAGTVSSANFSIYG